MRLTAKGAFGICLGIWVFVFLPYFVPALNVVTPKILGLPFTVFWQYFWMAVHTVFLFFANKYVWDPFDGGREDMKDEENSK